jgi:hypothetical protein
LTRIGWEVRKMLRDAVSRRGDIRTHR